MSHIQSHKAMIKHVMMHDMARKQHVHVLRRLLGAGPGVAWYGALPCMLLLVDHRGGILPACPPLS